MKRFLTALAVVLCSGQAYAAIKACGELKSEIAAKLDVLGVKSYELTIADKSETVGGKVVGSCENSSKKITYIKQAQQAGAAAPVEAEAQPKPELEKEKAGPAAPPAPDSASSSAIKPCGELKAEIAAKLDAAGVKSYQLDIVENGQAEGGKLVGSCENGSKKIMYLKK